MTPEQMHDRRWWTLAVLCFLGALVALAFLPARAQSEPVAPVIDLPVDEELEPALAG